MKSNDKYYVIYKPYGMLSQFTREVPTHLVLADLGVFPKNVYPVGRLDKDSEGLLILTNDTKLNERLLHPKFTHSKTYTVQVDGSITEEAGRQLERGVEIRINKQRYRTKPARARLPENKPKLPERNPPVRFRKNIPTSWLYLTITEGKNRQGRKMCAQVGFPVLRLVRTSIENLHLGDMQPGEVRELSKEVLFRLLKI